MADTILHRCLIEPIKKGSNVYRYRPLMIELLSRVVRIDIEIVAKTKIYQRSPLRYIPFYLASRGGGAITLGNHRWHNITFTENFFSGDTNIYGSKAYANKLSTWLRMSAHECGHLHHTHRYKSFIVYLITFAYQYMKHGHDAAPLEHEAEGGWYRLAAFRKYLDKVIGNNALEELIESPLLEEQKITTLREWWDSYSRIAQ